MLASVLRPFQADAPLAEPEELPSWAQPVSSSLPNLSVFEAALFVVLMSLLIAVRQFGLSHEMKKEAVLNMGA